MKIILIWKNKDRMFDHNNEKMARKKAWNNKQTLLTEKKLFIMT